MMVSPSSRIGVYTSYDEDKNGSFLEAVSILNNNDYLVWLERSTINPRRFAFPTTIVIKIKGKEIYYSGTLIGVKPARLVDKIQLLEDRTHRPLRWKAIDQTHYRDFKSILYISGLKRVPVLPEVQGRHPPQRPYYFAFKDGA